VRRVCIAVMNPVILERHCPILAIGDVHGMTEPLLNALAEADAIGAFPILLGDLVDKGPHSVGVLRIMMPRVAAGEMAMLRGNHDERLLKSLTRPDGEKTPVLAELLAAEDVDTLADMTGGIGFIQEGHDEGECRWQC
jgi:hypothetical protein